MLLQLKFPWPSDSDSRFPVDFDAFKACVACFPCQTPLDYLLHGTVETDEGVEVIGLEEIDTTYHIAPLKVKRFGSSM